MQAHYTRFTRESVFLGRPSPSQVLVIQVIFHFVSAEKVTSLIWAKIGTDPVFDAKNATRRFPQGVTPR